MMSQWAQFSNAIQNRRVGRPCKYPEEVFIHPRLQSLHPYGHQLLVSAKQNEKTPIKQSVTL